jgi:hypothetical protein
MSEELVLAAKMAQDLAPQALEVAKQAGFFRPLEYLVGRLSDKLYYERQVQAAFRLKEAAEKIAATGLPAHAVPDALIRAVIEHGGFADDAGMQERWANLLANAAIAPDTPHPAFPEILSQLQSVEAQMLEAMDAALVAELRRGVLEHSVDGFRPSWFEAELGISRIRYATAAANLARLELVSWTGAIERPALLHAATRDAVTVAMEMTHFGAVFVAACRPPGSDRLTTLEEYNGP